MFGLSLGSQLIQDSAERTWNCISQIANLVWYKFNNLRQPIMPRQRRRHHSRSRSRSRSHTHEKERGAKRIKIDVYDSPNHKRSVSLVDYFNQGKKPKTSGDKVDCEESSKKQLPDEVIVLDSEEDTSLDNMVNEQDTPTNVTPKKYGGTESHSSEETPKKVIKKESSDLNVDRDDVNSSTSKKNHSISTPTKKEVFCENKVEKSKESEMDQSTENNDLDFIENTTADEDCNMTELTTPLSNSKRTLTQKSSEKKLTPKQMQKKIESEEKRIQREKEKEERDKQKQNEKEERERQKQSEKEKKEAERLKKLELKQKEKEEKEREKEQRRLEKEKREEQKRREKEEEKQRKQQEIDEKNREKLKEEEKKQKAAAAFVSFFVPKKTSNVEEKKSVDSDLAFVPFQIKSEMKLPPQRRQPLTEEEKNALVKLLNENGSDYSYLVDLKSKKPRTCPRTWPSEDDEVDLVIVEDEDVIGETICEDKLKSTKMKAKFLKFHENQRPAYYGTWRKKSENITGRNPLGKENIFDYEVDSDDDWEEEEQGENLEVFSDDDKENEPENDDYEVDNEFFVPHGHLSDDEVDDEEMSKLSPESQKQKLKLLKDAFEIDIKSKTHKIKPRATGCIWYNKKGDNVDDAINRYLNPLNVITNGQIQIKERHSFSADTSKKLTTRNPLPENLIPVLVKLVHGNTIRKQALAEEFIKFVQSNNVDLELTKTGMIKHILNIAKWTKNDQIKTKYCWMVQPDIAEKYGVELVVPNVWESIKGTVNVT